MPRVWSHREGDRRRRSRAPSRGDLRHRYASICRQRIGRSPTRRTQYPENKSRPTVASSGTHNLFVGNLPFSCSTIDLFQIFQKYGRVVDAFISTFPGTARSRGFVFVRFQYEDDARAAIGVLHGRRIDGRVVTI
ncbi:serine/arginine-rich splicing factor SC35-like [Magnolia sinica]|uniref:serine/arginine-rich splicing factor SC35-like n=1 Tax=Magnolia sinica TaxID=86752 RepID=UPI0026586998|nr:serine/arginine-rich splicing factor SC35-like [Magnolia sinica]